nr:MAG TPA: hypothetical protein [Caudoviricetes sp.]
MTLTPPICAHMDSAHTGFTIPAHIGIPAHTERNENAI